MMIKGARKKRKTTTSTSTKAKKKPTPKTSDDDVILASLPHDLLLMIMARVPRLYYPNLSLVSKRFRCMVASPELYKARSLSGLTESYLYVCLRCGSRLSSYKWYTLSSSKSSSSGGYVLVRVPVPDDDDDSPFVVGSGHSDLVTVGSDIYNIGTTPLPEVSILDCKSHTWRAAGRRKAPSMPVEMEKLSALVLDRKIYVLGRSYHQDGYWKNSSFMVLDTNTQTWDDLPCHGLDCTGITFAINGKLHAVTRSDGVFAFDSKHCRWDVAEQYSRMPDIMFSESYCEIDNVLYSVSNARALRWYDTDETRWRDLKGLVGMPELPITLCHAAYVKLTGYGGGGGKMMVFWTRNLTHSLMETIYCAKIALEKRNGDCWGKLEWCDAVLSVPVRTKFVKVLSVTL